MADVIRERMLIGGREAESISGQWMQIENPSRRGVVFAEVPCADAADVDRAVKAAAAAFRTWRMVSPAERGRILLQIAAAIVEETDELSRAVASEDGNIIRYTRGEVQNASDKFRYYGGLASELKGTVYPSPNDALLYTRREPIGVVAAMMPWNSPLALGTVKIAPILLTGNTIVFKVPQTTPVGVLKMAKIANRFLPPGVLNIITGYGTQCGLALVRHPMVRKISFTGSSEVGKILLHEAADRVVLSTMNLSGKNPQIVYPDVNQDQTASDVIGAVHIDRMGQSCASGSRIYIHRSIFDAFVDKMAQKLRRFKLGDACDEQSDIGPIANKAQYSSTLSYIEAALNEESTQLVCGGLPSKNGPLTEGYYIQPTLFISPDNNSILVKDEVFGPVIVAIPWEDEAEVLNMVNDSDYGLVAYVWCSDTVKAMNMAHAIEAGTVIINYLGGPTEGHPYGGVKASGYSRENCFEGVLENYTTLKAVTLNMQYPPI